MHDHDCIVCGRLMVGCLDDGDCLGPRSEVTCDDCAAVHRCSSLVCNPIPRPERAG